MPVISAIVVDSKRYTDTLFPLVMMEYRKLYASGIDFQGSPATNVVPLNWSSSDKTLTATRSLSISVI